jgi:hypothetical protein
VGEMTAAVVLRRGLQAPKDGSGFARLTRGCGGGAYPRGTRQRLSEAVWSAFGDQGSVCAHRRPRRYRTGQAGVENCEQRVVGRRAYNRQRRRCTWAEKHRLQPLLRGAWQPDVWRAPK